jgi:hypothetical protein
MKKKIKKIKKKENIVTICRSFSYKLNLENIIGAAGRYESRDFFASQSSQCKEKDAETTSEALYQFCKKDVIKAVNAYISEVRAEKMKKETVKQRAIEVKQESKERAIESAAENQE